MRARFAIDDWHQFSLTDVIDFVLAIVSTLLLLSGGERRRWEVEADLLAWKIDDSYCLEVTYVISRWL